MTGELTAMRLLSMHNLTYTLGVLRDARQAILEHVSRHSASTIGPDVGLPPGQDRDGCARGRLSAPWGLWQSIGLRRAVRLPLSSIAWPADQVDFVGPAVDFGPPPAPEE